MATHSRTGGRRAKTGNRRGDRAVGRREHDCGRPAPRHGRPAAQRALATRLQARGEGRDRAAVDGGRPGGRGHAARRALHRPFQRPHHHGAGGNRRLIYGRCGGGRVAKCRQGRVAAAAAHRLPQPDGDGAGAGAASRPGRRVEGGLPWRFSDALDLERRRRTHRGHGGRLSRARPHVHGHHRSLLRSADRARHQHGGRPPSAPRDRSPQQALRRSSSASSKASRRTSSRTASSTCSRRSAASSSTSWRRRIRSCAAITIRPRVCCAP